MGQRAAKRTRREERATLKAALRGEPELLDHLREQRAFLRLSAESFDAGHEGEAKRLAVTIRVLVHDTQASTSLLSLLRVKNVLRFVDSAVPLDRTNLLSTENLLMMRMDPTGTFWEARLDKGPPELYGRTKPFVAWWNHPVSKTVDGRLISRRDYVLGAANREGGAHVNPELDPMFDGFAKRNPFGWEWARGEEPSEPVIGNAALHAIRQVAWEVEETLNQLEVGDRS